MIIYITDISGETFKLTVLPTDRILYLKMQIGKNLDLNYKSFDLQYQGRILGNDDFLDQIPINENSLLNFTIDLSKSIHVKYITGRIKRYMIDCQSANVLDLKRTIQKEDDFAPKDQKLIYKGIQLEDRKTLSYYSIDSSSMIFISLVLRGGKPVIYLYPEIDNFDVKVKINMDKKDGEITSIYTLINENDNNTWIVKANKNGQITYKNRKHCYLFWECLFNKSFDMKEGFLIEGKKSYEFFEQKLEYLGFKENEANDFITYWCPRMEHSKYVFISFQGEEYNKRAPLNIEPKPDCLKRIFMTFKLLDEKITVLEQNIDQFKINERKGFFVLEWGGSQVY